MDDEGMERYLEAGRIASRILTKGAGEIRAGASYLGAVERIEEMVKADGAGLAFPLNVSINEDAAHDTASAKDDRVFSRGDLVKLDLGVHLDGYIADTATTIDLGDHHLLVEASRRGLDQAISMVRPGVSIGELGTAIHHEIEARGFKPVANLTGHGLDRYMIHTPPNIPNVRVQGGAVLEEGMVFAIEPFASTGCGRVTEKHRTEIYQQLAIHPVRLPSARHILEEIRPRKGMPFSKRWLSGNKIDLALAALIRAQVVRGYPVLSDVPGSLVSQAEHTLIVTSDGCIVTTA
ncbi:MAG: Methionine aminopeptidase [Methanoregulaceae archaeon PtaU1.Bin222]|jgi:methionyl aminopeptidase|nr:MAG: Methionine aminopeptidase [Methanoregulaceae archaeon PtaU1.Bin222]